MMFMIAPVVCGVAGAMIAEKIGLNLHDFNWWLVCAPWWFLGATINSLLK